MTHSYNYRFIWKNNASKYHFAQNDVAKSTIPDLLVGPYHTTSDASAVRSSAMTTRRLFPTVHPMVRFLLTSQVPAALGDAFDLFPCVSSEQDGRTTVGKPIGAGSNRSYKTRKADHQTLARAQLPDDFEAIIQLFSPTISGYLVRKVVCVPGLTHAGEPLEVAHIFPFSLGRSTETKEYMPF